MSSSPIDDDDVDEDDDDDDIWYILSEIVPRILAVTFAWQAVRWDKTFMSNDDGDDDGAEVLASFFMPPAAAMKRVLA